MNLMMEKIKKLVAICWLNGMKPEVENRPETYEVHSWVFMIHNGTGHCVVRADSLDTILLENMHVSFSAGGNLPSPGMHDIDTDSLQIFDFRL